MSINLKEIASRILKLASDLEKEAAEKTYFVCDSCNHTTTLAAINDKRTKMAASLGITKVDAVTIDNKLSCPACEGTLSYVPTKESSKYYVETADEALDELDVEKKKEDSEASKTDMEDEVPDIDLTMGEDTLETGPEDEKSPDGSSPAKGMSLEPKPEDDTTPMSEEEPKPEEGSNPEEESKPEDMPPSEETSIDMAPAPEGDQPRGTSLEEPPAKGKEAPPVTEEEPVSEDKPKKKNKDKNVVDIPKFEKMPKDASEDYKRAYAKYSSAF